MRVLFMTNVPSPYRVDFFNALGILCNLTVLFETRDAKSRNTSWVSDKAVEFKAVFMKGIRIGEAEAICPEVIKYLSKKKYDAIVVGFYSSPTGMMAIEYMRFRHIPFILSSDGGMKSDDAGLKYRIKKHFIGAASAWLSTGAVTTDYLCYYGAKREKVYKYPFTSVKESDILDRPLTNGEKQDYKVQIGITEEKMVLSVGQFIYRKGYDILLKTCEKLDKNIGIYIVGGQATTEYLELQDRLQLNNVHFVDFMTKDKLINYYKAADLFILPTREDIWGLVVNEAMAYGLQVITTDKCLAGIEMIKDRGRIVPVETNWKKVIEENIKELNFDKQAQSIKVARFYSIENMAFVHFRILEQLEEGK